MKRNVAGLVVVFVGAAVAQLATSNTYLRYVKPGMRWGTYWGQGELTQLGSFGWFTSLEDPSGFRSLIGSPPSEGSLASCSGVALPPCC